MVRLSASAALPERPFGWREKRSEYLGYGVILVIGAFFVAVVVTEVDLHLWPMRLLLTQLLFGLAISVAYLVALAFTRRLPVVHRESLHGTEAVGVRAWPADWYFVGALDASLTVVGLGLAFLSFGAARSTTGADATTLWVAGAALAVAALYFAVRVGLSLAGVRRRDGVWLSAESLILESPGGVAMIPRDAVVSVDSGRQRIVVGFTEARVRRTPRPWRSRDSALSPLAALISTEYIGHTSDDLVAWLRAELGMSASARP